jgi:hypothetical protein
MIDREQLWSELEQNLNFIGGGKMEKPKAAGLENVIDREVRIEDFWTKVRDDFNLWAKDYKAKLDQKLHNAQAKITELENQNVILAREVVKHRRRDAQIAELMGWHKAEKK